MAPIACHHSRIVHPAAGRMHTLVRRTEARRHDLTRQQPHTGRQIDVEQGGAGAKLRQRVAVVAQRKPVNWMPVG